MATMQEIDARQIRRGANDREEFAEADLMALAQSIKSHGLLAPPIIRPCGNSQYEIVAGERRVRAMRDVLKWQRIPAFVRELDDEDAAAVMLLENTSRIDLNPLEEARAYKVRIEKLEWSLEKVAEVAGEKKSKVKKRLLLNDLSEEIRDLVKCGVLKPEYAELLAGLDANRQHFALMVWKKKPQITMMSWKSVISQYREQQAAEKQMSMFQMEDFTSEVIERMSFPRCGPQSLTGGWVGKTAPSVPYAHPDAIGDILLKYARILKESGQSVSAADAVMNVYNLLVSKSMTNVARAVVSSNEGDLTAEEMVSAVPKVEEGK